MSAPADRLASALAERYRLVRELGAGGMATVWLAHDLRHDRQVAIKVLHPELAAVIGADRFLSEIRTTANLQHPHILPLFDSGECGGFLFYVMPVVEGESLRDRIAREKQLPIAEAVRIATEVADALDYAHRKGVVHRDIKPENILLHEGRALVSDFGIALAASRAGGSRMTETGMSLGTPSYMSPEQAMGERELTARSDVYALGVVLYEMLTGDPPFSGSTAQAIVARVITERPRAPSAQRDTVPPHVEAAVLTALEKLPADRYPSAAEFSSALRSTATTRLLPVRGTPPIRRRTVLAGVAGVALGAVLGGLVWRRAATPSNPPETRHVELALPDSAPLAFIGNEAGGYGVSSLALSPDGRVLVYAGGGEGRRRLFVRSLDGFEVRELAGTEGASQPFLSPDGRWVAFIADEELRKVPLAGGPVTRVAKVSFAMGGAWPTAGEIVVCQNSGSILVHIPADGGPARIVPVAQGRYMRQPEPVSGGAWLLGAGEADAGTFLMAKAATGEERIIVRHGPARPWPSAAATPTDAVAGSMPKLSPDGHLLYVRPDGTLMSLPFDAEQLAVTGEPEVVAAGVRVEAGMGSAEVDLADDGTLAYVPGRNADVGALAWMDRRGRLDTLPFTPDNFRTPDVSPDGRRLAVALPAVEGGFELWTYDLRSGRRDRVLGSVGAFGVRWTPDGRYLVATLPSHVVVRLDPARPGWQDTVHHGWAAPMSVTRDGRLLGMVDLADNEDTTFILRPLLVHLDGTGTPEHLRTGRGIGLFDLSPDGKWIAYVSDRGGVYVEPRPPTGEAYRISGELPGDAPYWSRTGTEIVFPSNSKLYHVRVHPGTPPSFDPPELIAPQVVANFAGRPYAVAPDEQRFLVKLPPGEHGTSVVRLALNAFAKRGRR